MPFPDELDPTGVHVLAYRDAWVEQAAALATRLRGLVPDAVAVEHIGSTSIPGMSAKDCLDLMIVVEDLVGSRAADALTGAGFRRRPEPWNNEEPAAGRLWPKMVFAPPAGDRRMNIHVRLTAAETTHRALLFRDFLRASPSHVEHWSTFKVAAAAASDDLAEYGAIKAPAWALLMELAEQWAEQVEWVPEFLQLR